MFQSPSPLINSFAAAISKPQLLQRRVRAKLSPNMQEFLKENQNHKRRLDTSLTRDRLLAFLFTNGIVCPKPIPWQRQYREIASIFEKEERAMELEIPMVLEGWWRSSAIAKRARFLHHIEVAEEIGILRPIADHLMKLPLSEFLLESEINKELER